MSPTAFALLFAAAVLHAGWNLLLKRAGERLAFAWWASLVSAAVALPVLALAPPLPPRVLPYAVASAAVEAAYFLTLASAYGQGDFSLVYPVARGTAPALLALWAALFLGERPGPTGLLGLGLIVAGLVVMTSGSGSAAPAKGAARSLGAARLDESSPPGRGLGRLSFGPRGLGAAVAVAFFISGYSVIDGAAVRFAPVVSYTLLVFILTALMLTPPVLRRYGLPRLRTEWRGRRTAIVAVAVGSLASYVLVLAAFAIAPVAYAGAVREVGVVIAALAGWLFLGEGFGARRTAGAVLVFTGILAIATSGS